jgi:hypothetical protein
VLTAGLKTISSVIATYRLAGIIQLERLDEQNPDGIGSHYRYRFSSRADVLLVIQLVNYNAFINGHRKLTQCEIIDILDLYPDNTKAA